MAVDAPLGPLRRRGDDAFVAFDPARTATRTPVDEHPTGHIFVPAVEPPPRAGEVAWWFAVRDGELTVVESAAGETAIPSAVALEDLGLAAFRARFTTDRGSGGRSGSTPA